LEAFAQLCTDLDAATQKQLDRGARMVQLLKKPQYVPFIVTNQVISIYAGTKGFLDDVDLKKVPAFEKAMQDYFQTTAREVHAEIAEKKALDDELTGKLEKALKAFKSTWKG
ncbi:MAG: F0F1 ATP synthase subunit alpha, partial [Phycisphaerales bacterium]|nr:F0F1 ATP synthase subunit alpha [Phycisphaerales bacterium]